MMYVPICGRKYGAPDGENSTTDSNLLVVEHQRKVYFVAAKEIRQGEQLKAAYSPAYKAAIGKTHQDSLHRYSY